MKKLLILGASVLQLPAIRRAKELGYYVGVVDMNPSAIGAQEADEFFPISTTDVVGVVKVASEFKPDGVMTLASDMPMRSVAEVCLVLGLPGISVDTAYKATNKAAMIQSFSDNGVAHPWYFTVPDERTFDEVRRKISFPCIIKPVDNAGSRGVVLVHEMSELDTSYAYSRGHSRSGEVIIEEFLSGSEVSVEVMAVDGTVHILAITDKLTTGAPHFVEMGHSQPTRLNSDQVKDIEQLTKAAVCAIGIINGPAHVEIMVTDQGARMIELGARMGGDCITTHLVPLSTGIDMVEATIRVSCGEIPDIAKKFDKGSAIRYFRVPKGIIQEILGTAAATSIPGIREVTITRYVGDEMTDIQSSTDRAGYIVAQASSAEEAIVSCETAMEQVVFRVEGPLENMKVQDE